MSWLISFALEHVGTLATAVAGIGALLAVLFGARKAGRDAAVREAQDNALEMNRTKEEIRRELDVATEEELEERARPWRID